MDYGSYVWKSAVQKCTWLLKLILLLTVREKGPGVNKNYSVHVAWVGQGMEGGGAKEMCSWDGQTYILDSCEILGWVGCTYIQSFSP